MRFDTSFSLTKNVNHAILKWTQLTKVPDFYIRIVDGYTPITLKYLSTLQPANILAFCRSMNTHISQTTV